MQFATLSFLIAKYSPIIFNTEDNVYKDNGLTYEKIKQLEMIGLISYNDLASFMFVPSDLSAVLRIAYYGDVYRVQLKDVKGIDTGKVMLSTIGQELAPIAGGQAIPGFSNYAISEWIKRNCLIYSDYPKRNYQIII